MYIYISSLTSKTCQISLRVEKQIPQEISETKLNRGFLSSFCCFTLGRPSLHVEKTAAYVSILGWMIFFCFKFRWSWGCVFFQKRWSPLTRPKHWKTKTVSQFFPPLIFSQKKTHVLGVGTYALDFLRKLPWSCEFSTRKLRLEAAGGIGNTKRLIWGFGSSKRLILWYCWWKTSG